jgi:hypothetical protein
MVSNIIFSTFLIVLIRLFHRTHDQVANFSHRTFLFRDVAFVALLIVIHLSNYCS